MATLPDTVAGFAVFPATYSSEATHIIYGRAHVGSKKAASQIFPEGRSLFLVNVPPDATERELALFFKRYGTVEKVVFDRDAAAKESLTPDSDSESDGEGEGEDNTQEQAPATKKRKRTQGGTDTAPAIVPLPSVQQRTLRETGGTAHVVFLDASSLERALTAPHAAHAWPRDAAPVGLARYMALHDAARPPLDAVRAHADSAIAAYDWALARGRQKSKYRMGEAVVDEDGFTLVTRGGMYGKTLGGGVGVASKKFEEEQEGMRLAKKKKGEKEKEGFYAFQVHEKKRKELIDLRKKWEQDKAKVAKLKESRGFKPY